MNTLTTKRLKNIINEKIGTLISEDLVFQVSSVQAKDTNKTTIYIGAMSDGEYETTPIFIFNKKLENNNIVVLKTIEVVERSSKVLVLVKKHEVIDDNTNEKVGNPVLIYRNGEVSLIEKAKDISKKNQREKEAKALLYSNNKQGVKTNTNNNNNNTNNTNNQGKNNNVNQGNNYTVKEVKKSNYNNNNNNNNHNNDNINQVDDEQEIDYENSPLSQYYKFHDIDSFTENFIILVRVVALEEKNYVAKKSKEPGVLGKYTLIDYAGEEMDITVFNKTLDIVKSKLSLMKVYEISRVDAKPNENRRRKDSPNFSISFNNMTTIEEVTDESILRLMPIMSKPAFLDLKHLPEYQKYDEVDVMLLLLKSFPIEMKNFKKTLNNMNNGSSIKRILAAGASSEPTEVEITFFGEAADQFESLNLQPNAIFALKRAVVSEYNGVKKLNSGRATIVISKENDLKSLSKQEYKKLEALRDGNRENIKKVEIGNKVEYSTVNSSIARMLKIASVTMTNDVVNRQPIEAFRIPGYASLKFDFGDSAYYPACPSCKKKMTENNPGSEDYNCKLCKNSSEPNWNWKINFMIKDKTDKAYVSGFGVVGDQLTGMSAKEFYTRSKSEGAAVSLQLRNEINFRKRFIFIVKPKVEEYQGSNKLKYNVLRVIHVNEKNISEECGNLLNNFENLYIKK